MNFIFFKAIRLNDFTRVRSAIKCGADINAYKNGETPLILGNLVNLYHSY